MLVVVAKYIKKTEPTCTRSVNQTKDGEGVFGGCEIEKDKFVN